jgi:peptidoglycan hydrolase-like protein with peptidoglycan-binding domain
MSNLVARAIFMLILSVSAGVWADDLTRMAQEDLETLGFDVGAVDGEPSTKTIIAISKFQAEKDMEDCRNA